MSITGVLQKRGTVLISMAVLALVLSPALIALANVSLTRVSTDPYTNSSSQHQTEEEPDSYSYGATTVSAFQVGRFFDGGASNIGWSTTTDNGATWTNGFLPGITIYGTPPGSHQRVSDASVAYDAAHGVWMIVSLTLEGAGAGSDVVVSRSTNGGTTWQNPVSAHIQNGLDKTWVACDSSANSPYYGHCYAEWDDNFGGNIIQMSTSTDGGLTWGAAKQTADFASGLGGQPVVQPGGRVIVPTSANDAGILSFNSTDGGNSWGSSVNVANVSDHGVAGNLRTSPLPSAEIDPQGRVYVVWQDCRFRSGCSSNDIVMSTSLDGNTWSAVTRIPIDPVTSTVDHFIPGIGVNKLKSGPPAQIGLTYYYYPTANCSTSTCQLTVGYVSSNDGGASWTTPTQVAGPMTVTWLALTNQGYMVGDYISTSISNDGKAHPVFAVANAPTGSVFDEAMYSPTQGLPLDAKSIRIKAGGDAPVPNAASDHPPLKTLPTAH
jgi:BNR repeat-like domain